MSGARKNTLLTHVDWLTVILTLILILVGWINIYAANYSPEHSNIFDLSREYGKQFIWIVVALVATTLVFILDPNFFIRSAFPLYLVVIVLLIAVLLFGKEVNGAKSWFGIGAFGIQPSEFAKLATALALAAFISSAKYKFFITRVRLAALGLILVPAALILLQPDAGTLLVFLAFVLVLYREGLSGNVLLLGILALMLSVLALLMKASVFKIPFTDIEYPGYYLLIVAILLIGIVSVRLIRIFVLPRYRRDKFRFLLIGCLGSIMFILAVNFIYESDLLLQPHHKTRIDVLMGLEEDPMNAGYNVNQSKTAIGSGGFGGKGFLKGTLTKYKYVPMQSTDFIFCTIGEEWGFLGSATIVLLYFILLLKLIIIAERQRSQFTRVFAYSVASIMFLHVLINIGMAIGLAPVIGIPLPFFSYGGSSLIAFATMIAIVVKLDASRLDVLR